MVSFEKSLLLCNYHLAVVPLAEIPQYLRPVKGQCKAWDAAEILAWSGDNGDRITAERGPHHDPAERSGDFRSGDFVLFAYGHDAPEAQAAPSFKNKASDPVKFKDRNGRTIEPKGGIRFRDIQVGDTAHTTTRKMKIKIETP